MSSSNANFHTLLSPLASSAESLFSSERLRHLNSTNFGQCKLRWHTAVEVCILLMRVCIGLLVSAVCVLTRSTHGNTKCNTQWVSIQMCMGFSESMWCLLYIYKYCMLWIPLCILQCVVNSKIIVSSINRNLLGGKNGTEKNNVHNTRNALQTLNLY